MSVGVYMPARNTGKYITEAIDSIQKQTYTDWELVILDDCSTDNTLEVAYKQSVGDPRVYIYKRDEPCGLIGKLKNEAISKFKREHKYIAHVGSDDLIPNHCFQTFVDYMESHPEVGAVCGNFICFDDTGKQWSFPHVANSNEFNPNVLLKFMNLFPMRFYRKEIVDKVGGYSSELSSAVDYDLALKISEITTIHRIKNPITYYYRQHNNQVSTKARSQQDLNAKKALQDALKRRNINGVVENNAPPFRIRYV
jgi:glycosyltransferase involved in cell wall biosynthesis